MSEATSGNCVCGHDTGSHVAGTTRCTVMGCPCAKATVAVIIPEGVDARWRMVVGENGPATATAPDPLLRLLELGKIVAEQVVEIVKAKLEGRLSAIDLAHVSMSATRIKVVAGILENEIKEA